MTEPLVRLKSAVADRYTIDRELGRGGMATVYLAEDLKHHRHVAVKVLDPELARALGAERFLREVEVTANLNHPHILPLHDSGEADGFLFYVMPYVEGETLRERMNREGQLPLDDALQITKEVATALSYAHSHDVIHRDIKPENVLLSAGEAVVADFGIARAITEAGGEHLTETGLSIGTPIYMSPEQASGAKPVTGQADLYSLACVLYEMLTEEPPYTGPTAQAIVAKKLSEPAPRVSVVRDKVPPAVEAALDRALSRTPADRYATVQQFAEALSAGTTVPETETQAIVVLPFENLSPDPDNEYFVDGLTEELITDLSQVSSLRVVSRTSAMMFKGARKSIPSIAREMGVQYALEGTVRKAGTSLRITAQLIDTSCDAHLWAGKFSGTLDDVFDIQETVSREIVDALKVKLTPEEDRRMAARPIDSVAAYDSYLRAIDEIHGIRARLQGLKDRASTLRMDAKTAATLLLELVVVVGFEPELLEEGPNRVLFKTGRCPIYVAGRALGLDHSAIEALCRTRILPRIDRAAKELDPRLRWGLVQFRAGKDDSCIEEILMTGDSAVA
jgi:serine/threonine-protein kinase